MTVAVGHRFLLVMPTNVLNRRSGGGQRTALVLDALRRLGPTEILLAGRDAQERTKASFPGNPPVHALRLEAIGAPSRFWPAHMVRSAMRLLAPAWLYRPRASAAAAVEALVARRGVTCILYRYTPALTMTDAAGGTRDGLTVLVDLDDREDQKYLTFIAARLGRRVGTSGFFRRRAEALRVQFEAALARTSLVWLVKNADRTALEGPVQRELPNAPHGDPPPEDIHPPSAGHTIFFVGSASFSPNRDGLWWFLASVWPRIADADPHAQVRVAGIGDWKPFIRAFGHDKRIAFLGAIPALLPEYARARLAIVPIFAGAGSQIKLIEACAHGRPVVCSQMSSQGYGPDIAALVSAADTPEDFAAACLALLADGAHADRVGAALRAVQTRQFSREGLIARIANDVASVLPDATVPRGASLPGPADG